MTDFDLDPVQRRLKNWTRTLAFDVLSGVDDAARTIPRANDRFQATKPAYTRLVQAGCLRAVLPDTVGGTARGAMDVAIVAEELTAVNASVALTLFATGLGLAPLIHHGTPDQQRTHLPRFLAGHGAPLAAFALTEPGGSANFTAPSPTPGVRTTAQQNSPTQARGDGPGTWVLTGNKKWVSNAGGWQGSGPDLLCVVARTSRDTAPGPGLTVFAMPGPVLGLRVTEWPDTIGYRSHSTPTISLTGVAAADGDIIDTEGAGAQVISSAFNAAGVQVAAFALALTRTALNAALQFTRTENRGGPVPIINHQAVGQLIVSAQTRIEAARSLTWRACRALDAKTPTATELALHAKVFASETAVAVICDLMRVVGVDSYVHSQPFGQLLQDALALPVLGGGNVMKQRQLHALITARG